MATTSPLSGPGGHHSFAPFITPVLDGTSPPPRRLRFIIHAFRMRLGGIGGFTTQDVHEWLKVEGFDVDVAIEVFLQLTVPNARTAHETNRPGRTILQCQKDYMIAGASYSRHGNHRRTISVLYEMIQAQFPGDVTTVLRLANLLREAYFDYEEAVNIYSQRRTNSKEMADIDRAERRLCMRGLGGADPTQVHKDNRMQIFLEVAGTDDWISVRGFLSTTAHAWNLGRAFDTWMQSGLSHTRPTSVELRRVRYRDPQLPHIEQDNLWPVGRPLFQITAADATDLADAADDYGMGAYVGESCRFIGLDPQRAVAGINRPDMLEQFYMNHGKGSVNKLLPDGVPEGGTMVPMSFYNTQHISLLNKAYAQNPKRAGGVVKRAAGVRYTDGESDWMYCWHEDRVMEYQAHYPGFTLPTGHKWKDVVDFDIDELTDDLNHEFQGKVVAGSSTPRPEREARSVELKRSRIQVLCNDFGFNFNPAHS